MSDSVANLLSHIQNGQRGKTSTIQHFKSQVAVAILKILQENGYIRGFRYGVLPVAHAPAVCHHRGMRTTPASNTDTCVGGSALGGGPTNLGARGQADMIEILLKYKNQKPAITRAIRISKPSKRVYVSVDQLKQIKKLTKGS